jgi:protein-S-isoprenylcysteine O-methyltransferase Ste14
VTVSAEEHGRDGTTTGQDRAPRSALLVGWIRFALTMVVYGLALFACAGTLVWPAAWAYLGLMTAMLAGYMVIVGRQPDLLAERRKPPADAKPWDKPLVAIIGVIGPVALLLACGFDRRFHWSPPMSATWKAAGLLLVVSGSALSNWAVATNRFFSSIVRIQRDRGHHVVDTGPYRRVRHPGYLASLAHMPGVALALGSLWALTIAGAIGVVVVVRTALEDRTLQDELDGYAEYAGRVRYRLLPGVW